MIKKVNIRDRRFELSAGAGSDAIHKDPQYSYAVAELVDESGNIGTDLTFTLGELNDLVCKAAAFHAEKIKGSDIENLMADFGRTFKPYLTSSNFDGWGYIRE